MLSSKCEPYASPRVGLKNDPLKISKKKEKLDNFKVPSAFNLELSFDNSIDPASKKDQTRKISNGKKEKRIITGLNDDGFRIDFSGFPDPTSEQLRTIRIEVQLENYPDCIYEIQPSANTTL